MSEQSMVAQSDRLQPRCGCPTKGGRTACYFTPSADLQGPLRQALEVLIMREDTKSMTTETRILFEEAQRLWVQMIKVNPRDDGPAVGLGLVTFYLLENREPSDRLINVVRKQVTDLRAALALN